jgi:hypothetical protein
VPYGAAPTQSEQQVCRYILRPPVAQDALELTPDGKVLLRLRRPWRDGTRALCFEPSELLEKLAAMIPRPRIDLLLYHGAFAPRGRCHSGPVDCVIGCRAHPREPRGRARRRRARRTGGQPEVRQDRLRIPVTFGGGITIEKRGRGSFSSAWKYFPFSHASYQRCSVVCGS